MLTASIIRMNGLSNLCSKKAFPKIVKNLVTPTKVFAFTSSPKLLESQTYTERAYTPSYMSKLLVQQLSTTKSHESILHQLSLYYSKLLPFDYDYFTESLKRLIHYQQKMSTEEILMLFDLAIEYKIDSLILQTHFQNQLYCRVHLAVKKELLEYDQNMKKQLDDTFNKLEQKSQDYFNVINEKFKELMEDDHDEAIKTQKEIKQEQENFSNQQLQSDQNLSPFTKPIYHAGERKNKAKSISQKTLLRITKTFLKTNSRNVDFNRLLLQLHTTRLDQILNQNQLILAQQNPQFLNLYTKLAVNLLQSYMSQYQSSLEGESKNKKNKYTHRSVKNVYKLQNFYYYEVAKMVEDKKLLQKANDQELIEFLETISGFPIKRRSFRKSIGTVMIEQTKKRQIDCERLLKFFELSRYDNKLLQHFEKKINQGKSLSASNESTSNLSLNKLALQTDQSLPQELTPQVMIDSSTPAQTLFRMPGQLFRKVTKKKSKPKRKFQKKQDEIQIDLTQQDQQKEDSSETITQANKQIKNINNQSIKG